MSFWDSCQCPLDGAIVHEKMGPSVLTSFYYKRFFLDSKLAYRFPLLSLRAYCEPRPEAIPSNRVYTHLVLLFVLFRKSKRPLNIIYGSCAQVFLIYFLFFLRAFICVDFQTCHTPIACGAKGFRPCPKKKNVDVFHKGSRPVISQDWADGRT